MMSRLMGNCRERSALDVARAAWGRHGGFRNVEVTCARRGLLFCCLLDKFLEEVSRVAPAGTERYETARKAAQELIEGYKNTIV
jgi:hypothetical protein